MQLSERTVAILNNFNLINPLGMVFPEGNQLAHAPQQQQNILVYAEIDEDIQQRFAVYDVSQLLNCIRAFNKPQINVDGLKIIVSDLENGDLGEFVINGASETVVKEIRNIKFPEDATKVSFTLTNDMFKQLLQGIGIVQAPQVVLIGDGKKMYFTGLDDDNTSKSSYKLPVGETRDEFRYVFPTDNIGKLMKGMNYQVSIAVGGSGQVISRFKGDRLTYYLAVKA